MFVTHLCFFFHKLFITILYPNFIAILVFFSPLSCISYLVKISVGEEDGPRELPIEQLNAVARQGPGHFSIRFTG